MWAAVLPDLGVLPVRHVRRPAGVPIGSGHGTRYTIMWLGPTPLLEHRLTKTLSRSRECGVAPARCPWGPLATSGFLGSKRLNLGDDLGNLHRAPPSSNAHTGFCIRTTSMDPLSITAGVATLLGACVKIGTELKKFHDDVGSVSDTLSGMLEDVSALGRVLDAMRVSFDGMPKPTTGHIGTHWENIKCSLEDGKETLTGLQVMVNKVNKDVSIFSGPRKLVRLKSAEVKISQFRQQIRSFRDTLQLSMQALILYANLPSTRAHRLPGF